MFNKLLKKNRTGSYNFQQTEHGSDSGYGSSSKRRKPTRKSLDPRDLTPSEGYSVGGKSKLSLYNEAGLSSDSSSSGLNVFLGDRTGVDRNGNNKYAPSFPTYHGTKNKDPPDRGEQTSPKVKTKSKRHSRLTSPSNKRRAPAPPPVSSPVPAVESADSSFTSDNVFSSPSEDDNNPSDMSVGNEYPAPLPAAPLPLPAPVDYSDNRTLELSANPPARPSRPPPALPKPTKRPAPSPLVHQQRRSNSQVHSTVITSSSSTITIQIKGREPENQESPGGSGAPANCRLDVKYVEEEEGVVKDSGAHVSRRSLDNVPYTKPTPPPRRSRSRSRLPVDYVTESMSVDSADSSDQKSLENHQPTYENFALPGSVQLRNSPVLSDLVTTDEEFTSPQVEKSGDDRANIESEMSTKTPDDYLHGYPYSSKVTPPQDMSAEQVVPRSDATQLLSEIQHEVNGNIPAMPSEIQSEGNFSGNKPDLEEFFDVDDVVEEGPGPSEESHLSTPGTSTPVRPRAVPRRDLTSEQPLPVYDINSDMTYTVQSDVTHTINGDIKQNRTRVQYENVNITTNGVSYAERSRQNISQTVSSHSDVITKERTSQQSTFTAHYVNQKDTNKPFKTFISDEDPPVSSLPGLDVTTHSVLVEEDYVPDTPEISALTFLQSPTKEGIDIETDLPIQSSYPWEDKPVHSWDADDIIEWCQAKDLDIVAEKIQGVLNNGSQLLQLNARDLDILQITDPDIRRRLLEELQSLQDIANTSPSLCRLRRVSVRRKTLEFSGDLIRQRLYNLQKLNEKQQSDIDSSLSVLQEEQRSTEELLRDLKLKQDQLGQGQGHLDRRVSSSVESLTVTKAHVGRIRRHSSLGDSMVEEIVRGAHKNYSQLPLTRWNNADVVHWLEAVGMDRFIGTFREHNVCGRDLAEVNMKFLDDMQIRTVEDREQLLSKLYELQHPQGPSLTELLGSEPTSPVPPQDPKPELHRGLSVQPGDQAMALQRTKDTRLAHSRRSNTYPEYDPRHQEADYSRHMDRSPEDTVHVWHDLRGKLVCHPVTVRLSTTAGEVVERLLVDNDVTDDPLIYYIVICDDAADGMTKEIRSHETPLTMYKSWSQDSTFRFELRMRITSTIRVVCHISDQKQPRGKVIKISTASTCSDVLKTAIRKFRATHNEHDPFCLLEVHPATGALRQVDHKEVMYELHSDAFIFCNQGNRQKMLTAPAIAALRDPPSPALPRRPASADHSREGSFLDKSEKQSRLSLPAPPTPPPNKAEIIDQPISPLRKYASSDVLHRVSPNKQKLPSADGLTRRDADFAERLELLRELALMKDSMKERDMNIELLMQENQRLKEESSGVHAGDLRRSVSAQNVSRLGNRDGTFAQNSPKEGTDEIRVLSKELYDVTIAVQNQEDTRLSFSKDLERAEQNGMGPKRQEQLKRALGAIEAELLTLKTRQAQVFAQLEVARNNVDKKKEPVIPDNSLYGILREGPPQLVVTAQLDTAASALGFLAGRDERNRQVIKHVEQGRGLQRNDRLLEVNGTMVFSGTDIEVQQAIKNAKSSVNIVALRDNNQPIMSAVSDEEVAGLKEDLSLAMMEVETLTQDNQDLTREMSKMRQYMDQLRDENERLLSERDKLQSKVSNSDVQWHELRTVLRKMQDGNLDPAELESAKEKHDYRSANGLEASSSSDKGAGGPHNPMAEVLQVLKDHILETKQQRAYLSSLMSLVVMHAPHLILKVDQESRDSEAIHLKKRSEEFC